MTASNDWSLHLVRKSGGTAEQQIAASLIVTAREGCAAGNADDCAWLHSCALAYLALITPPGVDEYDLLDRLLQDLQCADPPPTTWREAAETFVQALLSLSVADSANMERSDMFNTEWGKRMNLRPASKAREPTDAMQLAIGLEELPCQ